MTQGQFDPDQLAAEWKEKLEIRRLASQAVSGLFTVILLLAVLIRERITAAFIQSGDDLFMVVGKGMRILLILFLVIAVANFAKYTIAFLIVYKQGEHTEFGLKFLRFFLILEAISSSTYTIFFGIMFGGVGAFLAFTESIEKPAEFVPVGMFFTVMGGMIVIKGIYTLVRKIMTQVSAI